MARSGLLAAMLLACGCSPYGGGAFVCTTDPQCGGDGKCSNGFCSFPDTSCDSGFRYGELSGPNANRCVGDEAVVDGGVDGPMADAFVAPDGLSCYGTGLVTACFTAPPTGARTINTAIDTNGAMCQEIVNSTAWCVIAAETISVTNVVNVTGGRPLVLVATSTLAVSGTLDVASHRQPAKLGPGANAATCNAGTAPGGDNGGGAGGSFGSNGGNGGGNNNGTPGATITPTMLQGGCPGQNGGGGGDGGARGNGGGAVYLIADGSIAVSGRINASGAGAGAGQANQAGGGGAGAGGMIGLDAPIVNAGGGEIFANGGGGGEGGTAGGGNGTSGTDPLGPNAGGNGGSGSSSAGDGGDGAGGGRATGQDGGDPNNGAGGGGGGGGAGVIKLHRATSIAGGNVSPAPS